MQFEAVFDISGDIWASDRTGDPGFPGTDDPIPLDLSFPHAAVFVPVRSVSEPCRGLQKPTQAAFSRLYPLAGCGSGPGQRSGEDIDSLLVSVVSAELQYLVRPRLALVPLRQRQGKISDSGRGGPDRLRRRLCAGHRTGMVPVPDTGVLPLFLAGTAVRQ